GPLSQPTVARVYSHFGACSLRHPLVHCCTDMQNADAGYGGKAPRRERRAKGILHGPQMPDDAHIETAAALMDCSMALVVLRRRGNGLVNHAHFVPQMGVHLYARRRLKQ